jgi:hypothetical protein
MFLLEKFLGVGILEKPQFAVHHIPKTNMKSTKSLPLLADRKQIGLVYTKELVIVYTYKNTG